MLRRKNGYKSFTNETYEDANLAKKTSQIYEFGATEDLRRSISDDKQIDQEASDHAKSLVQRCANTASTALQNSEQFSAKLFLRIYAQEVLTSRRYDITRNSTKDNRCSTSIGSKLESIDGVERSAKTSGRDN